MEVAKVAILNTCNIGLIQLTLWYILYRLYKIDKILKNGTKNNKKC